MTERMLLDEAELIRRIGRNWLRFDQTRGDGYELLNCAERLMRLATTLPSSAIGEGGDGLIEEVARLIEPRAFKAYQLMVDHCIALGDTPEVAKRWSAQSHGGRMTDARAKAAAIITCLSARTDEKAQAMIAEEGGERRSGRSGG